ncbi:MAG: Plug domain-containing protein [Gammaproteobacteria bacterium]|nr:Plug domain-containing protein [Gammaproteobacteria bacterium]
MKTDLRRSFPVAGMSLAALLAQSGTAQQADDDAQLMLEEIVVTAQKRSQSIQEVPVAMTALGGEALEDNGAVNLEDLSGIAPNVQLTQMAIIPNVGSFTIRGINFTDPDPNADPKTGVSLDGVPLTRNNGLLMDMFDIESVEVLRGPGELFVHRVGDHRNVETVAFVRDRRPAAARLLRAEFRPGEDVLVLPVELPVADGDLGAQAAVGEAAAVEYRPQDLLAVVADRGLDLAARLLRRPCRNELDRARHVVAAVERALGPATSNVLNDPDGIGRDGDEYEVHQDVDGYSDFDTWGLTLQANRELDAGTLTLVAGHRELEYETFGDFDGHAGAPDRPRMLPPPFSFFQAFHVRRIAEHDQQTVELRFADAHSDRFDYVVGLFHVQEEFTQHNFQNVGFPPLPIFFPLDDPDSTCGF